jgi:outer membrane immunogenic protein
MTSARGHQMTITRFLLAGAAAAALTVSSAQAADLLVGGLAPSFNNSLFNYEGFYIGATAGLGAFPGPGTVGTVGVVAGANFAITDAILAGVEFQGDALWNGSGIVGVDALFLGKLGGYLADETIVYGTAGGGWIAGTPSYGLGLGIETAIAQQISARGEVMATGSWGGWPNGAKATVGLLWHMN